MKLHRDQIDRSSGAGLVRLTAEDPEDMWLAYNLIRIGDIVTSHTYRRVVTERATGATSSTNTYTKLSVRVTKTDYDASSSHLRVSGQVAAENAHVQIGGFHTLDLVVNTAFTVEKADGGWDAVALETLRSAVDGTARADMWVVLMREGYANVCLVTEYRTVSRQKMDVPLPKKQGQTGRDSGYTKALTRFHQTLFSTILRQLGYPDQPPTGTGQPVPPVIVASPGFAAANFMKYIRETAEAAATNSAGSDPHLPISGKALRQLLPSFQQAHSNNASLSSIPSLLSSPALRKAVEASRSGADAAFLDTFHKALVRDDDRAWYGKMAVLAAHADGLITHGCTVLLDDRLFRATDTPERVRWVKFVGEVRQAGADCRIVSSAHQVGRRLEALGGLVVLLAAPAPHLNDLEYPAEDEPSTVAAGMVRV